MKNIYDNGEQLIGSYENIIKYIKEEIKENKGDETTKELYQEVKDLKLKRDDILVINYEMPFGFSYSWWNKTDIIK